MNGKERTRSGTKPGKGSLLITIYDSYLEFFLLLRQYVNFSDKKQVFFIYNECHGQDIFDFVSCLYDGLGFLK